MLNLFSVLGVFFILLGLPIQIWVAWAFVRFGKGTPAPFDPPREFVATGLFRFVRNPMYYGALCVLTGWVLLTRSMWMLVYAAFLITALHFSHRAGGGTAAPQERWETVRGVLPEGTQVDTEIQ